MAKGNGLSGSLLAGMAIAVVVGLGNFYAYLYEWGFTTVFDVPRSFIVIEFENVIAAVMGIIGVFFSALFMGAFILNVLTMFGWPILQRSSDPG